MGQITITTRGSFGQGELIFNAESHGHAHAVNEAQAYLTVLMRTAIDSDHGLHEKGVKPRLGYDKSSPLSAGQ